MHAKWAFVLLALVFGLGFVFLGIGSGSNGITDALQNAFNFGKSSGGTSISSLEHKTQKHPHDAQAWRDLATAYETKQRTNDAIIALSQYIGLRSKDQTPWRSSPPSTASRRNQYAQDYQAQPRRPLAPHTAFAAFPPPASSPFGKALQDPNGAPGPDLGVAARAGPGSAADGALELPDARRATPRRVPEAREADPEGPERPVSSSPRAPTRPATRRSAIAAYKAVLSSSPRRRIRCRSTAAEAPQALAAASAAPPRS